MSELAEGTCIPCKGGVPPLKGEELVALQEKLGNGWEVITNISWKKNICLEISERHLILQ